MERNCYHIIVGGIQIEVTPKSVKNAYIRVLPPHGEVKMTVPAYMRPGEIAAFAASRIGWIEKKQQEMISRSMGENEILLWGRRRKLVITEKESERKSVRYAYREEADAVYVEVSRHLTYEEKEAVIRRIYKEEIDRVLAEYICKAEMATGLHAESWSTRYMKSRWGSCNASKKSIHISTRLAAYPADCLMMVCVHELCHFKVQNHGKDFYLLMDRYCPDWETASEKLKY